MSSSTKQARENSTSMSIRCEVAFVTLCANQLKLALEESASELGALTTTVIGDQSSVTDDVIKHLQSVDRYTQMLANIQKNLEKFATYMNSNNGRPSLKRWNDLLEDARRSYTMEQERDTFDETFNIRKKQFSPVDGELF